MAPIHVTLVMRDEVTYSAAYLAQNNAPNILAITSVWCFLSLLVVAMRVYCRAFMVRSFGWDDTCILVTAALGIVMWVCFAAEAQYALGRHTPAISAHELQMFLLWSFPHSLSSLLGIMMVKVSVALLLLRMATKPLYRRLLWGIIIFMSVYTLGCAASVIWACKPISANWNLSERPHAKCMSDRVWTDLFITNSIISMVTDGVLALLPIPMIFKLTLSRRTKFALCIVLSLGLVAVICGVVKTHYQWQYFDNLDRYFHDSFYMWAALEQYLGIIAASLPTLKPMMGAFLDRARTTFASHQPSGKTHKHAAPTAPQLCGPGHEVLAYRKPIIEWETTCDNTTRKSVGSKTLKVDRSARPPTLKSSNKLHGFSDRTKDQNYKISTECSRSLSVDSIPAADRKDPVTSFSSSSPSGSDTGTYTSSFGPSEAKIVVTTKVTTTTEPLPVLFPITFATVDPPSRWKEKARRASGGSSRVKRTFEDVFRRHQIIPHVVAGNKMVETQRSGSIVIDWEETEGPMVHDFASFEGQDASPDNAWNAERESQEGLVPEEGEITIGNEALK